MISPLDTTLYAVIADIREASGLGAKPMLSELAEEIGKIHVDAIAAKAAADWLQGRLNEQNSEIERLRSQNELLRDVIKRMEKVDDGKEQADRAAVTTGQTAGKHDG